MYIVIIQTEYVVLPPSIPTYMYLPPSLPTIDMCTYTVISLIVYHLLNVYLFRLEPVLYACNVLLRVLCTVQAIVTSFV